MLKVCLITATKNRHRHIERLVRFVLNQTYQNFIHLIFNNSTNALSLDPCLDKNKFLLINNSVSTITGNSYTSLGEIYNDILKFIPEDVDVINFMDDDDVFFPDHIEEGIRGLEKCGKLAYKPQKSWYKTRTSLQLAENVMEPSIFIKKDHILKYGFSHETTAQHMQWLKPLLIGRNICSDPEGKPTYICDWSQEIPTFKTSGNPSNPQNFKNYEEFSKDIGDGIISPCSESWAEHYLKI